MREGKEHSANIPRLLSNTENKRINPQLFLSLVSRNITDFPIPIIDSIYGVNMSAFLLSERTQHPGIPGAPSGHSISTVSIYSVSYICANTIYINSDIQLAI